MKHLSGFIITLFASHKEIIMIVKEEKDKFMVTPITNTVIEYIP